MSVPNTDTKALNPTVDTESTMQQSQVKNAPQTPATPTSSFAISADLDDEIDDHFAPTSLAIASKLAPTTPSYLDLLTNELFYSRIIIFLITIFLLSLSICYTLGQILTVELSNFWCDKVTLEEVRAHSRQINSNKGVERSCWSSKQNAVNFQIHCTYTTLSQSQLQQIGGLRSVMERGFIHL